MRPHSAAVAALAVLLLAGCGPSAPPGTSAPASPSAPAATPVTTAAAAAPTSDPAAGTSLAGAQSWTMPDLVGSGLQEAQDAIQGLTDFGIVVTYSHDATGQDRSQVADRNWKVCDQNVPPGATITPETRIEFGAVKLDEDC